jgi:hypothetical protein
VSNALHPISTCPLPDGWSPLEKVEDVVDADGARLHRVGLASKSAYGEAVGSAADWCGPPVHRSAYELLERAALLEAAAAPDVFWVLRAPSGASTGVVRTAQVFPASPEPSVWAHARSNGVALHADWRMACERAELELVERDRLQRSWLGEIAPCRLTLEPLPAPLSWTRSYAWSAYAFPATAGADPGVHVIGVFGFPTAPTAPLVFGYGARRAVADARDAAIREAAQLLAFLWGEPLPESLPDPGTTAMAHLERFQFPPMQEHLRRWLAGEHTAYCRSPSATDGPRAPLEFVDLTPPWMKGGLRVCRAVGGSALPLTFGRSPIFERLPVDLRMHPIP